MKFKINEIVARVIHGIRSKEYSLVQVKYSKLNHNKEVIYVTMGIPEEVFIDLPLLECEERLLINLEEYKKRKLEKISDIEEEIKEIDKLNEYNKNL